MHDYFKNNPLGKDIFEQKWLQPGDKNIEGTFNRIAYAIKKANKKYGIDDGVPTLEILKMFMEKEIILGGRAMVGVGTNKPISTRNCYVIGDYMTPDSYGGIYMIEQEQTQLMKRGGGVGHDLSYIRPKGSPVNNSALKSTGIVPFMERYSNATREVAQDGRRGALMLTLDVRHPDAIDFINAKLDTTKITGANISIKLTNEFMQAVITNDSFKQQFPIDAAKPKITKIIKAKELWDKIIKNATASAEPGVLFWDTILENGTQKYGLEYKEISTNPCGEQPLPGYASCGLLHINIAAFVNDPFTSKAKFNHQRFIQVCKNIYNIGDTLVNIELDKIDNIINLIQKTEEHTIVTEFTLWSKIRNELVKSRRMGIGVLGVQDAIIMLGEPLDDMVFIENIMATKNTAEAKMNVQLVNTRGHCQATSESKIKLRNIANSTIAPTGTSALVLGVSPAIEPVYNIIGKRRIKVLDNKSCDYIDAVGDKWRIVNNVHPTFLLWADTCNIMDSITPEIIAVSPFAGKTALEIPWEKRIATQAIAQKYVDSAISSTINLPRGTTTKVVENIYITAYKKGLKGVTIYVDGSRDGIYDVSKSNNDIIIERPNKLPCDVHNVKIGGAYWTVFIGLYDAQPYEIFAYKDTYTTIHVKSGEIIKIKNKDKPTYMFKSKDITIKDLAAQYTVGEEESLTRLISRLLRQRTNIEDIIADLRKVRLPITTFTAVIVRILSKYAKKIKISTCPQCKTGTLVYQNGCTKCDTCDYDKCG